MTTDQLSGQLFATLAMFVTFRTNPVILRTNHVIFRTNPVIFRTNPVKFRTNPVILRTNTVIFRTNPISQSVSQSRDSPETNQRQFRDSPETVHTQSRDSPEAVQRQPRDSQVLPQLENLNIFKDQSNIRTVKSVTNTQTTNHANIDHKVSP